MNAIKHLLLTELNLSTSNIIHYPWFKDFKQGVRNIDIDVLRKDGKKPKLAIFNPMVEAMVKITRHSYFRLGLLLA